MPGKVKWYVSSIILIKYLKSFRLTLTRQLDVIWLLSNFYDKKSPAHDNVVHVLTLVAVHVPQFSPSQADPILMQREEHLIKEAKQNRKLDWKPNPPFRLGRGERFILDLLKGKTLIYSISFVLTFVT